MNISSNVPRPPSISLTPWEWMRKNLLSPWYNGLLTLLTLGFLYGVGKGILTWVLKEARWEVVTDNFRLFLVGQYPSDQLWRVWLGLLGLSLLLGLTGGVWKGTAYSFARATLVALGIFLLVPASWGTRTWLIANGVALAGGILAGRRFRSRRFQQGVLAGWLLYFPLLVFLLRGRPPLLSPVEPGLWGGLLLTFLLALVSIVLSFPIGVLLALGRRSALPAVRLFSVLYIEVIRGVPLVTVLFMADIMLPLFLPEGLRVDRALRAMMGFTLFSAAYVAENVRGGLQAIPAGQIEAAHALGLNSFQTTLFIILPQALRLVIPANVGQFISLFKDTSLVAIMGLLELLGIGKAVLANPAYMGLYREVYLFVALVYGIFSYAMSYASLRLEKALGVGER